MENLAIEISEVIISSRISNVTDNMDDVVDILQSNTELFHEVGNLLTKEDIVWVNRNNNKIFFEMSFDNDNLRSSCQKALDLDVELKWIEEKILDAKDEVCWEKIKYRYKRALKNLEFKNVTYYEKVREFLNLNDVDRWRYLNTH